LLDAGRIGVAEFDSCSDNDCFAFHGAIAGEPLAQAHMDLHDRGRQYDVLMAVWHHSLEGPPEVVSQTRQVTLAPMAIDSPPVNVEGSP
jgi:hypothetical protein